jgi:4-amino-4-deoxy-L-arabinose transferase
MGYWLSAVSIGLFGEHPFAVRLPSALASGLSALAVFLLVRRFGGGSARGLASTVILLSSSLFYVIGSTAVLDAQLTFFLTAALVCFFFAAHENRRGRRVLFETLFGIACGCAFLTKGFLAFVVPVLVIVPYLIWERRWREMFKMAWVPGITALVVVLPWCLLVHYHNPDFWRHFFWNEHIRRFASDSAQHTETFWFYVPVFLVGTVPWVFVLPFSIGGRIRWAGNNSLLRFAACWLVLPLVFLSTCRGKLATYILPCLPAFAILMEYGLDRGLRERSGRLFRIGSWGAAALWGVAAVTAILTQCFHIGRLDLYGDEEAWKWLLLAAACAVCAVLSAWSGGTVQCHDPAAGSARRVSRDGSTAVESVNAGSPWDRQLSERHRPLWFLALGFAAIMAVCPLILPARIVDKEAPDASFLRLEPRVEESTVLVTDGALVRSVCWSYKRSDVFLLGTQGELEYGLSYPDSRHRWIPLENVRHWMAEFPPGVRILMIIEEGHYRKWRWRLPDPIKATIEKRIALVEFTTG